MNSRVGEIYVTNEGYKVEIVEYFNFYNCTIKFYDNKNTFLCRCRYEHIKKGSIKNPNHPSVCNIGYFGIGEYKSRVEGVKTKNYITWINLLKRCYDEKEVFKHPTYKDVTVCEEWHNFQNFAKWFDSNYISSFELDKDILIKGNKIYSPDTCCFIPHEINSAIINRKNDRGKQPLGVCYNKVNKNFSVSIQKSGKSSYMGSYSTPEEAFKIYKIEKESYIKELADKWKDKITDKVYQALYNYQVEITD